MSHRSQPEISLICTHSKEQVKSHMRDWQLPIAYSKCCVFNIGSKTPHHTPCTVDTENIPSVEEVIDLGITLHKSLKFSSHVSVICCRAHRRANLIHKCFYSKDVSSLLSAFTTYVRPILEYCCVVWNSLLVKDINALEAVQRRFTKRIPGMKNLTYYQRLRALGIESLELRRLRADLLFTYKLVFGLLDVNVSEFFTTQFSNKRRGHRYKLYLQLANQVSDITVLVTESFVFGIFCQTVLILLLITILNIH